MNKISGIVIARNEEKMIVDCLQSLSFCDEIIVIDDGSTDRTTEIARQFTQQIFSPTEKSVGYVEAVRKFAVQKARYEWLLFVDADERVSLALQDSIKNIVLGIKYDKEISAYKVVRKNYYLGNHPWPTVDILERVFKKDVIKDWDWQLHTSPPVKGDTPTLSGYLNHYTHQTLSSMLSKTIQWSTVEAKLRFDSHHPQMTWWRFPRVMLIGFFEWYILQKGWKAGIVGLIEGMYQAFSMFVTYTKLWEMQQKK